MYWKVELAINNPLDKLIMEPHRKRTPVHYCHCIKQFVARRRRATLFLLTKNDNLRPSQNTIKRIEVQQLTLGIEEQVMKKY